MSAQLPDAIEHVERRSLREYAGNARTHSEQQITELAQSIVEFGWTNPVLVDDDGLVIAGHGRLMAADRLGIDVVPVIRLRHLTDAQRRAYVIADNQLALNAGWDDDALARELQELANTEIDLAVIGFDSDALDQYLTDLDMIGSDLIDDTRKRTTNNLQIVGKGANVGFQFGEHMVTLPRDLYNRLTQCINDRADDKRDVIYQILDKGMQ